MQTAHTIRLVTFDLDGTMLDDEWAHAEANRRIGARLGIDPFSFGRMVGYSVRGRWRELCSRAGRQVDIEAIAREHFQITLDLIRTARVPESPGLTATLRALRADGFRIAVTSSSDEFFVRAVLAYLQVDRYMDDFITRDQVQRLKPAPDIYLEALRRAGVRAGQALGVEDSEPGCLALRQAGMYSVAFLNEGKNPRNPVEVDAEISRMEDLLFLLRQLQTA